MDAQLCCVVCEPFIDAQAPGGVGGAERNAVAASNDRARARVASFTRSADRRTTLDPPTCPPYYMLHAPLGFDARFSTRSPLQKLSAPHSAITCVSVALKEC